MSHSKEYIEVIRYETTDGRRFENKDDAVAHQETLTTAAAYDKAQESLEDYFKRQIDQLASYEKDIADTNDKLNRSLASQRDAAKTIRKLESVEKRGGKLTDDQTADLKEARTLYDEATEEIASHKESLEVLSSKQERFNDQTYGPLLEAYGGPKSGQIFNSEYDALYDLVIVNTAKFIGIMSQTGYAADLEAIRLTPDSWWAGSEGGIKDPDGPKREFPAADGMVVTAQKRAE